MEGILGAVEGNGIATVDLNCVGTVVGPNRSIDFHVRTCLVIRQRVLAKHVYTITLKPSVSQLTHKPVRKPHLKRINHIRVRC